MATSNNAVEQLVGGLTVYHDIGLDTDGRSHHYDPAENVIVVCDEDRRGVGITDDVISEHITPPEWSTGVWDYIQYVTDETDVEWVETDAPTEPPEDNE